MYTLPFFRLGNNRPKRLRGDFKFNKYVCATCFFMFFLGGVHFFDPNLCAHTPFTSNIMATSTKNITPTTISHGGNTSSSFNPPSLSMPSMSIPTVSQSINVTQGEIHPIIPFLHLVSHFLLNHHLCLITIVSHHLIILNQCLLSITSQHIINQTCLR